jgi:hypothetical protein
MGDRSSQVALEKRLFLRQRDAVISSHLCDDLRPDKLGPYHARTKSS